MKKALALLTILALMTALLSGCRQNTQLEEGAAQALLPALPDSADSIPYGEEVAAEQFSAVLYFISEDGSSFTAANRFLPLKRGETRTENVVRILLQTAAGMSSFSFIHENAKILSCEESGDTATINLSPDVYGEANESQLYTLLMAVSNTALSVDGIHGVNVLINGQSPDIGGLPFGVQTSIVTGTAPAYAQIMTDYEYMMSSDKATVSRSANIYLPSAAGNCLIPVPTQLVFNNTNLLSLLLEKLSGTQEIDIIPLPALNDSIMSDPVIEVNEHGQRIVDLKLSPSYFDALVSADINQWQMLGALTLTLTSFVPDVYGLRLRIGDKLVTECVMNETPITFADGIMTRRDFSSAVGTFVEILLPAQDNMLHRVNVPMAQKAAHSPLAILRSLLSDERCFGKDSITPSDLLSVNINGGTATINLSDRFYRVLLSMPDNRQDLILYAMVNTLCAQDSVHTVSFTVEQTKPSALPSGLLPGAPLIANPGLIANEDNEEDA